MELFQNTEQKFVIFSKNKPWLIFCHGLWRSSFMLLSPSASSLIWHVHSERIPEQTVGSHLWNNQNKFLLCIPVSVLSLPVCLLRNGR